MLNKRLKVLVEHVGCHVVVAIQGLGLKVELILHLDFRRSQLPDRSLVEWLLLLDLEVDCSPFALGFVLGLVLKTTKLY